MAETGFDPLQGVVLCARAQLACVRMGRGSARAAHRVMSVRDQAGVGGCAQAWALLSAWHCPCLWLCAARGSWVGAANGAQACANALLLLLPWQIHSDSDEGDGSIKYTISGEGAGTIFLIDEVTGDIHATERLDREQKTFYTLRAQARDRQTDQLLEPESEFIIKVQDINDSEPHFLEGPYIGSVAELSPVGRSPLLCRAARLGYGSVAGRKSRGFQARPELGEPGRENK